MCTGACPVPASCKTLEGRSYHSCFGSCSALRERRVEQSETEKPHPQIWASIHAPAQTVPSPEYPRLHLHEALPSESAWHMASLAHMPWPTLHKSDVQSSSAEKQHPFQKGLSARDLPEGQAGTIIAHITLAQDTAKLGMRKWTEVKARRQRRWVQVANKMNESMAADKKQPAQSTPTTTRQARASITHRVR